MTMYIDEGNLFRRICYTRCIFLSADKIPLFEITNL